MSAKAQVDAVIAAMASRPQDFTIGDITMKDTKSGMEFWISNGFFCYGVYAPFVTRFGPWHGFRFARAVKILKTVKTQQKMALQ